MDLLRRLHLAVQSQDEGNIRAAVAAGADMDQVWGMQGTALCQAIGRRDLSVVRLLLELGCSVNAEDYDGGCPLSMAIRKQLSDITLLLIAQPGCDLNALDPVTKQRPLCEAVLGGQAEIVEALVQNPRCNITQKNGVGNSALHLSILHGHAPITRVLARCNGLRFLTNLAGHAPVHIAATLGHRHILRLLYPSSVRADEICSPCPAAEKELNQRVLLTGDTALHLATRAQHASLAADLIHLGACVNLQNNSGQTPLLLACADAHLPLALTLLDNGASPNVPGHLKLQQRSILATHARESSLTPLYVAAAIDSPPLVTALCEQGADVNTCDERGRSPLSVALVNQAVDVARYLLSRPSLRVDLMPARNHFLLHAAACVPEADITEELLSRGSDLSQRNSQGNMPLHEALCFRNVPAVRVLLSHGASPTAVGEMGTAPLVFAARTGCVENAEMLLAAGADINGAEAEQPGLSPDVFGAGALVDAEWSPLREALEMEMPHFARYLVDAGCDLSREKYLFLENSPPESRDALPRDVVRISDDWEDSGDDSDGESSQGDDDSPQLLKEDRQLLAWLKERAHNPHSLLQLSLEAVRSVFRKGDPPFALMLALPLPETFIAKLFYRDKL